MGSRILYSNRKVPYVWGYAIPLDSPPKNSRRVGPVESEALASLPVHRIDELGWEPTVQ